MKYLAAYCLLVLGGKQNPSKSSPSHSAALDIGREWPPLFDRFISN